MKKITLLLLPFFIQSIQAEITEAEADNAVMNIIATDILTNNFSNFVGKTSIYIEHVSKEVRDLIVDKSIAEKANILDLAKNKLSENQFIDLQNTIFESAVAKVISQTITRTKIKHADLDGLFNNFKDLLNLDNLNENLRKTITDIKANLTSAALEKTPVKDVLETIINNLNTKNLDNILTKINFSEVEKLPIDQISDLINISKIGSTLLESLDINKLSKIENDPNAGRSIQALAKLEINLRIDKASPSDLIKFYKEGDQNIKTKIIDAISEGVKEALIQKRSLKEVQEAITKWNNKLNELANKATGMENAQDIMKIQQKSRENVIEAYQQNKTIKQYLNEAEGFGKIAKFFEFLANKIRSKYNQKEIDNYFNTEVLDLGPKEKPVSTTEPSGESGLTFLTGRVSETSSKAEAPVQTEQQEPGSAGSGKGDNTPLIGSDNTGEEPVEVE